MNPSDSLLQLDSTMEIAAGDTNCEWGFGMTFPERIERQNGYRQRKKVKKPIGKCEPKTNAERQRAFRERLQRKITQDDELHSVRKMMDRERARRYRDKRKWKKLSSLLTDNDVLPSTSKTINDKPIKKLHNVKNELETHDIVIRDTIRRILYQEKNDAIDEMDDEATSTLDEFKRRLIQEIAKRRSESQDEDEMWLQLKEEYGSDCQSLWDQMRALTIKKLKCLLSVGDRFERLAPIGQMTSIDWMTFDMVLVHEDVDVIGEDLKPAGERENDVLKILFGLVQQYGIEDPPQTFLRERWQRLTEEYNTCGRYCSSVLLQKRWYQLKALTRKRLYQCGQPSKAEKEVRRKATNVVVDIVASESTEASTAEVQNTTSRKKKRKTNAQRCREYRERKKLKKSSVQNITAERSDEWSETDSPQTEKSIKIPKTVIQKNKEYYEAFNSLNHHSVSYNTLMTQPAPEWDELQKPCVNFKEEMPSFFGTNINDKDYNPDYTDVKPKIEADFVDSNNDGLMKIVDSQDKNPTFQNNEDKEITIVKNEVLDDISKSNKSHNITNAENVMIPKENEIANKCEENNKTFASSTDTFLPKIVSVMGNVALPELKVEIDINIGGEKACKKCHIDENSTKINVVPMETEDVNTSQNRSDLSIERKIISDSAIYKNKSSNKKNTQNMQMCDRQIGKKSKMIFIMKLWNTPSSKNIVYDPKQLSKNPDFNIRLKHLSAQFLFSKRNRRLFNTCKPLTVDVYRTKMLDDMLQLEDVKKDITKCKIYTSPNSSTTRVQSSLQSTSVQNQIVTYPEKEIFPPRTVKDHSINFRLRSARAVNDLENIRITNKNLLVVEVGPIQCKMDETNKPPIKLINPCNITDQSNGTTIISSTDSLITTAAPNKKDETKHKCTKAIKNTTKEYCKKTVNLNLAKGEINNIKSRLKEHSKKINKLDLKDGIIIENAAPSDDKKRIEVKNQAPSKAKKTDRLKESSVQVIQSDELQSKTDNFVTAEEYIIGAEFENGLIEQGTIAETSTENEEIILGF